MQTSLLEILRSIPDHRRAEGKRFDLAAVLLYAMLGMVAGANSYRQTHEFLRIHLQRLNEAFGLRLPYSPSYCGLLLILQGVDPTALEAAFRQHALSISTPPASDGLVAIAVDGKTLQDVIRRAVAHAVLHYAVSASKIPTPNPVRPNGRFSPRTISEACESSLRHCGTPQCQLGEA